MIFILHASTAIIRGVNPFSSTVQVEAQASLRAFMNSTFHSWTAFISGVSLFAGSLAFISNQALILTASSLNLGSFSMALATVHTFVIFVT
jgi:hypothetical protein